MARAKKSSTSKRKKPGKSTKRNGAARNDRVLREQIAAMLEESEARVSTMPALANVPSEIRGAKPAGSPHSLWQLLEHMRIAQWDILEFSRDPKHVSPDWPAGYWPASDTPPNDREWEKSVHAFEKGMHEMRQLVLDPKTDLFAKIGHGSGQTILREALLVLDHNAYHVGEFVLLRQLLGSWPPK